MTLKQANEKLFIIGWRVKLVRRGEYRIYPILDPDDDFYVDSIGEALSYAEKAHRKSHPLYPLRVATDHKDMSQEERIADLEDKVAMLLRHSCFTPDEDF